MQVEVMSKGKSSAGVFKGNREGRSQTPSRSGWGLAARGPEAVWAGQVPGVGCAGSPRGAGECGRVALAFGMDAALLL